MRELLKFSGLVRRGLKVSVDGGGIEELAVLESLFEVVSGLRVGVLADTGDSNPPRLGLHDDDGRWHRWAMCRRTHVEQGVFLSHYFEVNIQYSRPSMFARGICCIVTKHDLGHHLFVPSWAVRW